MSPDSPLIESLGAALMPETGQSIAAMLALLSMDEFKRFVDDDIRGRANPEVASALRDPQLLDQWHTTLLTIDRSVAGQLAAKTADLKAQQAEARIHGRSNDILKAEADFERWKASILRFKTGLEQRMIEVRHLLREAGREVDEVYLMEDRDVALARVEELEAAIRRHRDSFDENDDPSDPDYELWGMVGSDRKD